MLPIEAGKAWEFEQFKFYGLSLSGIRTAISIPEISCSFDVAQGYPFLLNLKKFFITHGHLDHSAGIPYIISQKAMNSQNPGLFYMPPSLVDPLDKIMKLWQEIEKHEYKYQFIPVNEQSEYEINQSLFVKAFPTVHRIESFGYTLFEKNKKLKKEFLGLNRNQIVDLKKKNIEIEDLQETPLFSFTGDTQIEFLQANNWIKKSKILFLESTYLDNRKSIQEARKWGHTHLDEIIDCLPSLECEKIVLIHISSRYSDKEITEILNKKIPQAWKEKISFFPGR